MATDVHIGSYGDVQNPDAVSIPIPGSILRCIDRGYQGMRRNANKRRLCVRFERGETFSYLDDKGAMQALNTATNAQGGGKPPHRIRNKYNYIRPIIEDKVSAATQRVPSYEIVPSTADPEDAEAASLAQRVAVYGYEQWNIRDATIDAVKTAIGLGGVAYMLPYFEPNVGPYVETPDGEYVGHGDIRIKVFGGNEAYCEPGCDWETSRWWATIQARPIDEVYETPGYAGGKLVPDASSADLARDQSPDEQMVLVTDYYERPCPKWPRGRWLTTANRRVIVDNRRIDPTSQELWQDYPLRDADGEIIDECLLHRLVYTHDPDSDDDLGLTWQLIDFQRSAQDCVNKIMELKNRGLNLQMIAPVNSFIDRKDDVPGAVHFYKLSPNGEKPQWEPPPGGDMLNQLLQIKNMIVQDMQMVAAFQDIQADPNVAARTGSLAIENARARWQSFLGDLAALHTGVMRHCLTLVARHYTEPRLLDLRGRLGWESIPNFRGAKLMGQTNVRISPGSLEYRSRAQVQAIVQYYASMQWITGQQAMSAIERGQLDYLTQSFDLDVRRISRIIERIKDGTIMDMPTRTQQVPAINPMTGGPAVGPDGKPLTIPQEVPAWMPDKFDSVPVWKENLAIWLKSDDFERSSKEAQEVGRLMWDGLGQLEAEHAQEQAQQQMQMAQSLGMGNAASPQGPPSPPSQPNISSDQAPPAKAPEDQSA
jgi:hypothetical protein